MEIIIDAHGAPFGRVATYAAKQALLGKKIIILNCNEAVITGKKHAVLQAYQIKVARGGYAQKGPYFSKSTEKFAKRIIRGMLPWTNARGKEAYKRIMCYNAVPEEYASKEKMSFDRAKPPYISLKELTKLL